MTSSNLALWAALCLSTPGLAQAAAQVAPPAEAPVEARTDAPFPPSTALAEGVSPEGLERLSELVQSFVDTGEVVGSELLVIKNGHTILHQGYGLRDREAGLAMEPGGVFCVRSMTKPVVAAAILMLVEDGALELGDRAAEYLPDFDVEPTAEITIRQLLNHTTGLPMSLLMGKDLRTLDDIQGAAALGAGHELDFDPGTAFSYSDQGTDTLTAIIEVAAGMPAADFVAARVLEPLGMTSSVCVMSEGHPLRARASALYAGSKGSWTKFWDPEQPPLFPFFLGSQGLYASLEDYARFMEFWRSKGRAGKRRLLRSSSVRKALEPGPHPMNAGTGFAGIRVDYGFLMQLWSRPGETERDDELVAFGHSGSDGTHAWVFPEQKAMVLYFTQSRGNVTGLQVEEALASLFLGAPFDPNEAAPPFEEYLGYYWEGEGDMYRVIVRDGDDLGLEIMGKGVVPLTYIGNDTWKFRPNPSVQVAFDRDEAGVVTGYHIGDHQEFRFEPSPELPSAEEIAKLVRETHGLDRLESAGPLRLSIDLKIPKLEIEGDSTSILAWPNRHRFDSVTGQEFERVAFDGQSVWQVTSQTPLATLEGTEAELARANNSLARFGDWSRWTDTVTVIQRLEKRDEGSEEVESVYLVRMGDLSAPARTLYVHWDTGRVFREDGLNYINGMGRIGQRIDFRDFRDVEGILLPHRTELTLANPLIGKITTSIRDFELGVELPEGTFRLED